MKRPSLLEPVLAAVALAALVLAPLGCSDDGGKSPDAGDSRISDSRSDGVAPDGPAPDGPGLDGPASDGDASAADGPSADSTPTPQNESEPNDGKQTSEVNAISVPAIVNGAVGSANDADVFTISGAAGQRLTVTITPGSGSSLQPHVAVFAEGTPPAVVAGNGAQTIEYYTLQSKTVFIAVRDQRNVGNSPAGVGDPTMTYQMTVSELTRAPIVVTVDGPRVKASLSPAGVVRVFSFNASAGDQVDATVYARRLTPSSSVDTRLSLFAVSNKKWLGTNDDLQVGQADSLLGGKLPFNDTYHVIIENIEPAATTFNIEVAVTTR